MKGALFAGLLLVAAAQWWVPANAGWQENVRPKISAVRSKFFLLFFSLSASVRVQLTVNS